MEFDLHTIDTAPEAGRADLEAAQQAYGTVPNLFRGFAANPATLKIYQAFGAILKAHGCLSPVEQQVVYLTVSAENGCDYCVAAHSLAADMNGMPKEILRALREKQPLPDARLEALRRFTLSVMAHRGWVPQEDLAAFQYAGYEQRHLLEVLTILAQKTLSNYYNHIARTPLDEMFQAHAWEPPGA